MSELQVFEMSFASYLFIGIVIFPNSDIFKNKETKPT